MFEAGRMPDACPPAAAPRSAVTGRFVRQQEGSDARKRDRKLTLTKVDTGTLDDIVRCERKADQAVRSLGISEAKREKRLTVQEYLEARDARMAAEQ
jgi:hypothetical protein